MVALTQSYLHDHCPHQKPTLMKLLGFGLDSPNSKAKINLSLPLWLSWVRRFITVMKASYHRTHFPRAGHLCAIVWSLTIQ
jgi:hypothetical protein